MKSVYSLVLWLSIDKPVIRQLKEISSKHNSILIVVKISGKRIENSEQTLFLEKVIILNEENIRIRVNHIIHSIVHKHYFWAKIR